MSTEALDCWDDYPMEHGCVCGNDCEPPAWHPAAPPTITPPVPQSKVPPHGKPGYSCTVWVNGQMVAHVGGETPEAATAAAETWLRSQSGE